MRRSTGTHVNLNRPGSPGVAAPPPRPRPGGTALGWHGLMDTTSNLGRGADSDCAPIGGASRIPIMSTTDPANRPAVSLNLSEELSLSTMLLSMRPKPVASSPPDGIDLTRFRQWEQLLCCTRDQVPGKKALWKLVPAEPEPWPCSFQKARLSPGTTPFPRRASLS
jgi:hypothetical protein